MKKLPISYPKSIINKIVNYLVPHKADDNSDIQLTVKIRENTIKSRELGSFLTFMDKVYGRSSEFGIYHYAHNRHKQLEISKIKEGCIELIIKMNIIDDNLKQLIILYIVLNYLPSTHGQLTAIDDDFEEAKFSRINRKLLKEQLKFGEEFKDISDKSLNRFVKYLEVIILKDKTLISSIMRFIRYNEIKVVLSII